MTYQVTAHIFHDGKLVTADTLSGDQLVKAIRFELDADSLLLAHEYALIRLRDAYPGKTVSVTAKEL